jgi:energy-coupling factor transporter transmembrane protein EcfT
MKRPVFREALFSYMPGATLIHRLDARAKLIGLTLLATSILVSGVAGLIVSCSLVLTGIVVSRIPSRRLHREIRGLYVFIALILVASAFTGESLNIGIATGALYAARLLLLVLLAQVLIATTTLQETRSAIGRLLRFLPASFAWSISSMMALVLSFVSIPLDINSEVRLAALTRGLDPRKRPYRYLKLLTFIMSVRTLMTAEEKSMAFTCRSGEKSMRPAKKPLSIPGFFAIGICLLFSGFALAL